MWGKECGVPDQGKYAAGKKVLGMWQGRALPLGMSKKGGMPNQGRSAAKGGKEDRKGKDNKGSKVCEVWEERREYSVNTRKHRQGQGMPKLQEEQGEGDCSSTSRKGKSAAKEKLVERRGRG